MMKALTPLIASLFVLVSLNANAKVLVKYQCPEEFGENVVLTISSAKTGSFYDLEAILTAPGQDSTSGSFSRSMKTKFEGSTDVLNNQNVYHFHDVNNSNHQIFAEIADNGASAEVLEVHVDTQSQKSRVCKVIAK